MAKPDLPPFLGPTLENLSHRHDLLRIMQDSHVRWMVLTDDPHLEEIHQVLVDRLEAVLKQYNVLTDALPGAP